MEHHAHAHSSRRLQQCEKKYESKLKMSIVYVESPVTDYRVTELPEKGISKNCTSLHCEYRKKHSSSVVYYFYSVTSDLRTQGGYFLIE